MSTLPNFGPAFAPKDVSKGVPEEGTGDATKELPEDAIDGQPRLTPPRLTPPRLALTAIALWVLCLSTLWPTLLYFWRMWTTDALNSIGMVVPIISLFLVVRVWRSLRWRAETNWWGFAILLANAAAVRIGAQALVMLSLSPKYAIVLPPPQIVLIAYASGVLLLFGGMTLLRAALFPVLFLWFASPVPHFFSSLVDLPLQAASAHLARSFALALGQQLTPDHLRLMFTPEFGMFIAPGCDGIRGSVTMGLMALVAGHLYRFRWRATALLVAGAVALGYLFNLLRLCALVLYYLVALHVPGLQNYAETADYILGAALFLLATLLLFASIRRLRSVNDPAIQTHTTILCHPGSYAPLLATAVLAFFGVVGLVTTGAATVKTTLAAAAPEVRQFPAQLGRYKLHRTWDERYLSGNLIYAWAEYTADSGGVPVAIGIAPAAGWHNPVFCRSARGETPLWQGQLLVATADKTPIAFSAAFYSSGQVGVVDASTLCSGPSCGQVTTTTPHFGLLYSKPDPASLLSRTSQPAVPVLLRAQATDSAASAETQRQSLVASIREFTASANLSDLALPYQR